jgi:hypothetical protein
VKHLNLVNEDAIHMIEVYSDQPPHMNGKTCVSLYVSGEDGNCWRTFDVAKLDALIDVLNTARKAMT